MILRDAIESDLPAIFQILHEEVLNTINTFKLEPLTPEQQAAWWRSHRDERYPVLVAVDDEALLGWASLSAWSTTHGGYHRTAEISIWIDSRFRGRRVGTSLLDALIARAHAIGFRVLLSKIEASNRASLRLHERFEFTEVGVMKHVGEKFNRLLDVVILQRELATKNEQPG
ncbi:MAG: N-acetyltransferase family protein [Pirellulaceae bacterium]